MLRMRKGFTLIELLVVIAIIAILAAILFPVFTKAKEAAKKAKNLNNYKQLGQAISLYSKDYDESYPLAFTARYTTGTWAWDVLTPIPHNWKSTDAYWSTPAGQNQAFHQWSNSTQTYSKSWTIHDDTGFNMTRDPADAADFAVANKPAQPVSQNLAFNGLLHTMTLSEIQLVSRVPVLWGGYGKGAFEGRSMSNPTLYCNDPGSPAYAEECRFNPAGSPSPASPAGEGGTWFWPTGASAYVWSEGMNFAFCDLSTKFITMGRVTGPSPAPGNTDLWERPFSHLRQGGVPDRMHVCSLSNITPLVYYPCMFRPDRTQ